MYPILRVGREMLRARRAPRLAPGEPLAVRTICWPWDIDPFMELNNGRSLTLADIGRLPLAQRSGLIGVLREKGWRLTMAGVLVQYRRRVPTFARLEIRSALIGRDPRFSYIEQVTELLTSRTPAHHMVYRAAVVGPDGIVPTDEVAAALGHGDWNPDLPPYIAAWAEAETLRPWPPTL